MIDPGPSGLVRAACNYELHASVAAWVSPPPRQNQELSEPSCPCKMTTGWTKFQDGWHSSDCIRTPPGKWELFDPDTKTYVVTINDRFNEHINKLN